MPRSLTISPLARQAGVGIDTVRYYERMGLLPEPPRRASGYRVYPAEALQRLQFIRRAKNLGFSLEEIKELLALSGGGGGMGAVKASAAAKLLDVENRIAELERMRDGLRQLVDACPGHGAPQDCPILAALSGEQA
jgi:MerR family copper efflux transcriptional regulator